MTDYLQLARERAQQTPVDADNPYLEVAQEQQKLQQNQVRTVLELAYKDNPDVAAERQRLSQSSGVPLRVVERNLDELRVKEQARAVNLVAMAQDSPILYRQLMDPAFTTTAVDDLSTLQNLERAVGKGVRYVVGADGQGGLPSDAVGFAKDVGLGATVGVGKMMFDMAGVVNDLIGWDAGARGARESAKRAQESMNAFGSQGQSSTAQAVRSGAQSAGQNLALLPVGLERSLFQTANAAATAVAGLMSAGVGADAFNRAREQGKSTLQAGQYAIPEATFEFVFERIPASKLFGDVAANTGLLKTLRSQALSEGWTEQVTTLAQDFNEWMNLNPEKTLGDFIAERPEAAYQTFVATMVGVGVQTSTIKGIDKIVEKASQQKLTFEQDQFQQQMALASQSLLRQRSPEQFRSHIQSIVDNSDEAKKEIYIDGGVLAQLPQDVLAQLPESVQSQIAEAAASSSSVAIPMADVLTIAPGTPLEQVFNDNARMSPDALSRVEAQQAGEQAQEFIKNEAERVLKDAQDQQAWATSSENVKNTIWTQLNEAGRFSSDVNEAYATLQMHFFSTMAARLGTTPEQVYSDWSLKVAGQQGQGGAILDQGTSAGLSLWHGSADPTWIDRGEAFDPSRTVNAPSKYQFLTPRTEVAETYAGISEMQRWKAENGMGSTPASTAGIREFVLSKKAKLLKVKDVKKTAAKLGVEWVGENPLETLLDAAKAQGYDAVQMEMDGGNVAVLNPELLQRPLQQLNQSPAFDGSETGNNPVSGDTIEVDGVQRPTRNSNGQVIHPTEEGVRNFWRWFGDSKVVDASGKPLVVYHGTADDFNEFKMRKRGSNTGAKDAKMGFWFSSDAEHAGNFNAARTGNHTLDVYLALQNPLIVDHAKLPVDVAHPRGDNYDSSLRTDAIAKAKKAGHDGVIFKNTFDSYAARADMSGAYRVDLYVAFDPTQIKSATGNRGTFDGANANILMQSGQDQRDLMVTHNLTAANLLHAVKMGGIAVPSLAITKKDTPLSGFGDITLIGDKNLADPKGYAGTKVFGADIYSPRYPKVSLEFTANMKKRGEAMLKAGMDATETRYIEWGDVGSGGPRELERTAAFMWQFLTEKGIEPNIVRTTPKPLPDALAGFAGDTRFKHELVADPAFIEAAWQAHTDMLVTAYDGDRAAAEAEVKADRARAEERGHSQIVSSYASDVVKYQSDMRSAGKIDHSATRYALENQVREANLGVELEAAASEFVQSIGPNERIFQGFTNSGNRKYTPHTLENVVKILKKELRGGEGFSYGVGSLRAKFTPQFKSIAQIKKEKGRLVDKATFEKVKTEIDNELVAISESFGHGSLDTTIGMLEDAATMGVDKAAKQYNKDIEVSDEQRQEVYQFLTRLKNLPTEYFEAKILRDVSLAEFKAAVVPEGVDPKALEALKANGITDIRTYKKGDEADRAAKIGELDELFFQNNEKARGTFNPQTLLISLNENADLSTFLHESGHFFLEVMADMASRPDAPQQIRDDMAAVLKWFGVADLATWNAMTLDQKREHHERWAESFEQYLLEGKAPSAELQPLFRRFRSWLVNVYKSLTQFMRGRDLKVSDEIRKVFDRMIATDEAIAQAEETAGLLPDFDATNEAIEKLQARSLRDLKWAVNARTKAIKALQKQAKELRKGVEAEVRAEVEAMPVYAARNFFRTDTKLSIAALEEIYMGEGDRYALLDWKPLVEQKLAGKEGIHPDVAADMFGFPTGDALVRAILDAEPMASVVEGMTDQRMLERHGDLVDQQAIEAAANEAVHNEARAKSLATELKSQAEMMNPRQDTGRTSTSGNKITVNAITEAAKQFAQNLAARRRVKDLRNAAHQHRAAEARAGKRWQEATAAGKTQEAVQAKRDQVLNNYTVKALQEAQTEAKKILEFFRRVTKDSNEKTVDKGRDPDVVNAMRAILSAYDVAPRLEKSANDYLAIVEKNDPAMHGALKGAVDAAMANAKPITEMTMEELRGLHDELQAMWHLAKRSRQMEVDGNLMDLQDAEDELQARMQAIGVPSEVPGETGALTTREELARKLQFAGSLLRRVEQWAQGMGNEFTRLVFQPVKDAANAYRADRVKYRKKYQALVDKVAPSLTKGLIDAPELRYTFGRGHNGIGHAELLHAILHTGNESNKRKLLLGRNWATENADGTLDTSRWDAFLKRMHDTGILTKAHYDFAQGVWDLLEETKPLAQKTHRDVFGRYFAEVTADAFETPFGSYRGGYVPAQADPRIVQDADLRKLAESENENMAFSFPATSKGFTKGRVEYNRPLMLDLRTIGQHIDKVLLFSHMEPAVRDVQKLLSRKGVSYSLGRIDPTLYAGMLTPWLNRSARQVVETPVVGDGGISRVLSAARNRAGMALMFANVSNTIQQLTGFSLAAVKVKPSSMMKATAEFIAGPKAVAKTVADASPFMADRMDNEISAINDAMDAILLDPNLYEKAQAWSQKHAYFLQTAMANTMEPIIWTAAYNDAVAEGQSERDAVRHADSVIRTTQGSTLPEDVSRIETGPAYARIFTQFVGYFNMMANTNATELKKIAQEMGLKKGAGKALGVVTLGMLVPLWIAEAIAQAMRGGPDDEDKDGYLDDWLAAVFGMGTIKGSLAMVPFIGQLANAAINRFNGNPADDKMSLSPAVSLLESAVGVPVDVYKAITDPDKLNKRTAVRDVASLVSIATGLPAVAVARPLGYLAGVADDKIDPTGPVDAVRGAVTGTPSPASK